MYNYHVQYIPILYRKALKSSLNFRTHNIPIFGLNKEPRDHEEYLTTQKIMSKTRTTEKKTKRNIFKIKRIYMFDSGNHIKDLYDWVLRLNLCVIGGRGCSAKNDTPCYRYRKYVNDGGDFLIHNFY